MRLFLGLFLVLGFAAILVPWSLNQRRRCQSFGRRKRSGSSVVNYRFTKKPDWVPKEIIRMKALMRDAGCRSLADTFNRRFAHAGTTVGKTYVSDTVRKHRYEILLLRRRLKNRPPKPMPINKVWAMDLTGKADATGEIHSILGLLEHGSRVNLCLQALGDKSSLTLLRCLIAAVERYEKPECLRTDNEAVFTSRLFRFGIWLLGIRHQPIEKGCPCDRHGWREVEQCRSNCRDEWQSRAVLRHLEVQTRIDGKSTHSSS